jgi:hypothetical protein
MGKGWPTGPRPNAPSDQCLPVSILVLRNALVLPIQFHLPDKSDNRLCEVAFHFSGLRVNQDSTHLACGWNHLITRLDC